MHTIRLRGPWQLEPIARFVRQANGTILPMNDDLPPSARATMPADWSASFGANFLGRVRYQRIFQKPTGLDNGERVFLVVGPPRSSGSVQLFETILGVVRSDGGTQRFDITGLLEDHNRLSIVVDHPALDSTRSTVGDLTLLPPGGLIGEVRLEIEE